MSLKNFITSRVFIKHLLLAVALVAVIVIFTLQWLKFYTRHGESTPVPNFTGLKINEIEEFAEQNNIRYQIIDSLHVNDAEPGVVIEQVPQAGFRVKNDRIVFLTINSTVPEKVVLPKLTDISFRQAQGLIENCGLILDSIIYEPSEFNNLVLRVEQDYKALAPGDIIVKGSRVDLIIGRSLGNQETPLPNLIGLTFSRADSLLIRHGLNKGVLVCDETIITSQDSLAAFIWKQYPGFHNTRIVSLGTSVDLWMTLDSFKIQQPALQAQ